MSVRFHSPLQFSSVPVGTGVRAPAVTVECPACSHANPAGARFCNECGSPVGLDECPKCDAINDRENAACYKCGAPMGVRTSAKLEQESATAGSAETRRLTVAEKSVDEGPRSRALATTGRLVRPMVVASRTRRRFRGRSTALAVGLFATVAVAVFSHFRPDVLDRTIATARSVLQFSAIPAPGANTPRGPNTVADAAPMEIKDSAALAVSIAPPKPDAHAASGEPSGRGARAPKEPGTRPISTAPGSASVRPPVEAPAVARGTSARTTGADAQHATVASALSQPATSAVVSARRGLSSDASDPSDGRNGGAPRSAPCDAAVAAIGLCALAAQSGDR